MFFSGVAGKKSGALKAPQNHRRKSEMKKILECALIALARAAIVTVLFDTIFAVMIIVSDFPA